jgi:hypothetical protein
MDAGIVGEHAGFIRRPSRARPGWVAVRCAPAAWTTRPVQ